MFSSRDFLITFCIGAGALGVGIVMAAAGAWGLHTDSGTPEYLICLRNSGLTIIILSMLWLALAAWKQLNTN